MEKHKLISTFKFQLKLEVKRILDKHALTENQKQKLSKSMEDIWTQGWRDHTNYLINTMEIL